MDGMGIFHPRTGLGGSVRMGNLIGGKNCKEGLWETLGGYICRVMFAVSCFWGSWVFPLKLLFWSVQSEAEYIFSFHLRNSSEYSSAVHHSQ